MGVSGVQLTLYKHIRVSATNWSRIWWNIMMYETIPANLLEWWRICWRGLFWNSTSSPCSSPPQWRGSASGPGSWWCSARSCRHWQLLSGHLSGSGSDNRLEQITQFGEGFPRVQKSIKGTKKSHKHPKKTITLILEFRVNCHTNYRKRRLYLFLLTEISFLPNSLLCCIA